MRLPEERKNDIRLYLLEKIAQNKTGLTKAVAEEFGIDRSTVYRLISGLEQEGIISRLKRDEYELVTHEYVYLFSRKAGELDSDTFAYDTCLLPHIKDLPENIRDIWAYAFSEMTNNVMDHSTAEHMQVTVSQNHLDTKVIIIDDGIGIFRKIRDHFGLSSLDDAVQELFKGKLTTDAKSHSGEGIFFTSKLMDIFYIVSDGKVFTSNRYDAEMTFGLPEVSRGTGVIMQLSNFTRKLSREVFDLYSDPDGGFTKTYIPLKNMFDSAPVSRSQAKRVCNRLSSFEEVEFDFDGISWMGQGFAHQIFVVFQNEHPDIRLIPKNMNADVEKMYRHVTA
ncbi:MAG: DUF4325 domain-containing protein [Oscillospiraceae bacterium]|nr:DUF4325 domain-containing protein [Oscillospiraceae bacterium]